MIQIADLGGIRLASLPLAMISGWVADVALSMQGQRGMNSVPRVVARFRAVFPSRRCRISTSVLVGTWALVAAYGHWRLGDVEAKLETGPLVAVIGSDVPSLGGFSGYDDELLLEKLKSYSEAAVNSPRKPQLVVWPEGIVSGMVPSRRFLSAQFDPRMSL